MSFFTPIKRRWEESRHGVLHATLNLTGPGDVARIFVVPPAFSLFPRHSMMVINGVYRLPLTPGMATLARAFILMLRKYARHGEEISDQQLARIVEATKKYVVKLYPEMAGEPVDEEYDAMVDIIVRCARNEPITDAEFGFTMREWAKIARGPERMDLMLTSVEKSNGHRRCNLDCGICYASELRTWEMPVWMWKLIIAGLKRHGVSQLTFTGGEPTVRKNDLVELIAASKWYITRLNTNGTMLDANYCRRLAEAELDGVQVTFYADDAEIHDALVGRRGMHALTVNGIRNAVAAGLNVSVNIPLTPKNVGRFAETLAFVNGLGVKFVTCSGVIHAGGGAAEDLDVLTADDLTQALMTGAGVAAGLGMDIQFTSPGQLPESVFANLGLAAPVCGAGFTNMAIRPDGFVVPCQSWINRPLGHMLLVPWSIIWAAASFIRNKFALGNYCPLVKEA